MRQNADFEDFYQANYVRLVLILSAVLGDRPEAEDAAQEAFSRALAHWPKVSGYDLPEMWVRRVALRIAVDSHRRWSRKRNSSDRFKALWIPTEAEPPDPLSFTAVGRALMRLPLREREVLVLHYVADMAVDQIAADRGLPSGTVKDRLASGRRRLERELAALPEEARDG